MRVNFFFILMFKRIFQTFWSRAQCDVMQQQSWQTRLVGAQPRPKDCCSFKTTSVWNISEPWTILSAPLQVLYLTYFLCIMIFLLKRSCTASVLCLHITTSFHVTKKMYCEGDVNVKVEWLKLKVFEEDVHFGFGHNYYYYYYLFSQLKPFRELSTRGKILIVRISSSLQKIWTIPLKGQVSAIFTLLSVLDYT